MKKYNLIHQYRHVKLQFSIIVFMFITALDGIVIPKLIGDVLSALESRNTTTLVSSGILGILSYFFVRSGLHLWSIYQQKYVQYFNNRLKGDLFRQYFIQEKPIDKNVLLNTLTTDIKYLEDNYLMSFNYFIYCLLFSGATAIYILFVDPLTSLIFIAFSVLPVIVPYFF